MERILITFDRTCDRSTALARYAVRKVSRAVHSGKRDFRINIHCKVEKLLHIVEISVCIPNRPVLFIKSSSKDMYESVGLAIPKLLHRIKHSMGVRKPHHKIPLAEIVTRLDEKKVV